MSTREASLETAVVQLAARMGVASRKFNSRKGDMDRIFLRNGRAALVEFKRPDGKGKTAKLQTHAAKIWREEYGMPVLEQCDDAGVAARFLASVFHA